MLIGSSRPGTQAANLQGVWNELLSPPWESKYTTNINAEMNYWPAEVTNLSECHEPLFSLIDDLVVSGGRTAQQQYNARSGTHLHKRRLLHGGATHSSSAADASCEHGSESHYCHSALHS